MLHYFDLYKYQVRFIAFLKTHPFAAGWLDMGLGKTASALTAYSELLSAGKARKALVCGPKRVASKVWPDEIQDWSHLNGLTYSRVVGSMQECWDALNKPADVHLVNRERFEWVVCQFGEYRGSTFHQTKPWPFDLVILDESQSFKAQSSYRWGAARSARRMCERLWQLTGTPVPNGYGDLWAQLFLLDFGKRLGASEAAFLRRWFDVFLQDGYTTEILKESAPVEIQRLVADLVMVLREEDYLELPPVLYNQIKVELSSRAMSQYKKLEREFTAEFGGRQVSAANAGVLAQKLTQLANGAVYYDDKRNWVHLHDHKIDALLEQLEGASGRQVMLAYAYEHDKQRLSAALQKFFGKKAAWRMLETDEDENAWNGGHLQVLGLHPKSGGEGSNLHKSGAEIVTWFGLTNNYGDYAQLNARLIGGQRRVGKNCVVNHIVASGTADDKLMPLIGRKSWTQHDLKAQLATIV